MTCNARAGVLIASSLLALVSSPRLAAQVPQGYQLYDSLPNQFTIALPDGWLVFDQNRRMRQLGLDIPEGFGLVYFSPVNLAAQGDRPDVAATLSRIDTGELPAFFVDRHLAERGMSCSTLTARGYRKVENLIRNTDFGRGSRPLEPLVGDSTTVGGCQGAHFRGRVRHRDGTEWVIDVRAVADLSTLYLFSLRNVAEYFGRNLPTYEAAMTTLHLAAAPARP